MPDRAATDRSFAVRMGLLLLTMIALGFGGRAWARGSAAEAGPPLATLLPHVGADASIVPANAQPERRAINQQPDKYPKQDANKKADWGALGQSKWCAFG